MKKLFKQFGLNNKETQTFLKLITLGAQPISVLAKHLDIPRPTVYLLIENLKKKSLVEVFEKFGIKYVKSIPVEELESVLEKQIYEIKNTKTLLSSELSNLQKLENTLSITPKVKFHEGQKEVEKMYDTVLKEPEFQSFFHPKLIKEALPQYHLKIPENIKTLNGHARELLVDCPEAHEYKDKFTSPNHQIKILPSSIIFPSDTIITHEKIFMIAFGQNQISAIEIWNPSLAQTQKAIFEALWINT